MTKSVAVWLQLDWSGDLHRQFLGLGREGGFPVQFPVNQTFRDTGAALTQGPAQVDHDIAAVTAAAERCHAPDHVHGSAGQNGTGQCADVVVHVSRKTGSAVTTGPRHPAQRCIVEIEEYSRKAIHDYKAKTRSMAPEEAKRQAIYAAAATAADQDRVPINSAAKVARHAIEAYEAKSKGWIGEDKAMDGAARETANRFDDRARDLSKAHDRPKSRGMGL
jgi:hypothetical protein